MNQALQKLRVAALRRVIKRFHYPLDVMLMCVRRYVDCPLSLRHIEEMMAERGVLVDHATVHRLAIKMLPILAAVFRRRKHPVGASWRMDETCILVGGQWKYLYRAVDRDGDTIDFLLRAYRDHAAARTFFERAIDLHGVPDSTTIDKSGANTAAIQGLRAGRVQTLPLPNQSTSTTSSNKTTGRSRGSCARCWGSSPCAAQPSPVFEILPAGAVEAEGLRGGLPFNAETRNR